MTGNRSARRFRALVWAAVLCLGTWVTWRALAARGPEVFPFQTDATWIESGDEQATLAQFRKVIVLPSAVKSAWLAVSAEQGYELTVNGVSAGRYFLWRPTRAFQTGLSERGQRIAAAPWLQLSFPREYQWAGPENARLPAFFDIGPLLSRGKNVVCVEVETRAPPARLLVDGEIVLWSGERIPLRSDAGFKVSASNVAEDRQWTGLHFPDLTWRSAVASPKSSRPLLRSLDPAVYEEPFGGHWLRASKVLEGAAWFETHWQLEHAPRHAFVRLLANRPFQLFVNDYPVRVSDYGAPDVDSGEWVIGPHATTDAPAAAEALDSDDTSALFASPRFEAPDDDVAPATPSGFEWEHALRGTAVDVPPELGSLETARSARPQPLDVLRDDSEPPRELSRPRERMVFFAYAIERLLRKGDNHIAVRLSPADGPHAQVFAPKLAVDGKATFTGDDTPPARLDGGSRWVARAQAPDGVLGESASVLASAAVSAPDTRLPRLRFRGAAEPPLSHTLLDLCASLLLTLAGAMLLTHSPGGFRRARAWLAARRGRALPAERAPEPMAGDCVLVPPLVFLGSAWVVALSWGERDELLWLATPFVWRVLLGAALALGLATGAALAWRDRSAAPGNSGFFDALPQRRAWPLLVASVLGLTLVLRLHSLYAQPLDDDELASTQAVLAIARSFVPRFTDDVFYTRGPLYHYLTAGWVWLFGESLGALRLPSVLFSVGTALVIYLMGARLLKSAWIGLGAALLYAVHPYAIFVGHLVRFYQQQQFFTLLAVYWFCRGFVSEGRRSLQYLALAAFLAACLSQELSIVLVPPLLLAQLLFGKRLSLRGNLSLWLVSGAACLLFAIDILVFQTQCLTKLEGISPNVEATLAPHFASPMNFLALFIGYSRLHAALSLLLVASLPLMLKSSNANLFVLLGVLFGGVLCTNLLVTGESLRYQIWLLPFWLLTGLYGIRCLALALRDAQGALTKLGSRFVVPAFSTLCVASVLLAFSPWKIPESYRTSLLGDSASAFAFVRSQLRPGDKVAATEPHPHAGLLEIGRIDYDLAVPLLHDFVYRKNGKLVDRNGSAVVVSSVEQLKDVIAHEDRLWVLVNREKFRSRGQNIRWEYPAARVELFLRQNFEVKYQSYLWTVFLWDARAGKYRSLPETARASWSGLE